MNNSEYVWSVSDFVAVFNQTIEYAYPSVTVVGELANFRVSKGRWVYFDLKDESASVKFFGTVYQLPGPLEDGLMVQVTGQPRLHPQFGFSITAQSIQPVGEGSLKRAAALLEAKLRAEGLFDELRKRPLPYPPKRIGLITSGQSAAYADFVKILNERWGGVDIELADVQVQGEAAPRQIVRAIEYFGSHETPPDVLVITRGGGSPEDLAAFSHENVTRSVATSRVPTLVAIGHEVDISLAELAADQHASTPSNAAQFLVPDKRRELEKISESREMLGNYLVRVVTNAQSKLTDKTKQMSDSLQALMQEAWHMCSLQRQLLTALSPTAVLKRGYAVLRAEGKVVISVSSLQLGQNIELLLQDGTAEASITSIKL